MERLNNIAGIGLKKHVPMCGIALHVRRWHTLRHSLLFETCYSCGCGFHLELIKKGLVCEFSRHRSLAI